MSEVRANNLTNANQTGGPTLSGITTFSSTHFLVPPSGDTASRPSGSPVGALRFNTDTYHLEYYRGDTIGWTEIEASHVEIGGAATSGSTDGKGTRGLIAGGIVPGSPASLAINNVDAITLDTLGNSIDFGNLSTTRTNTSQIGSATRSLVAGGVGPTNSQYDTVVNTIEFCNFATQSDYVDFGDLTRSGYAGSAFGNKVRACFAGKTVADDNVISYVTMSSTGDAKDFGDMTQTKGYHASFSSSTRGFMLGGLDVPTAYNTIEFVTTATTGNGVDFGDIMFPNYEMAAASNSVRGLRAGGYGPNYTSRIEFINMATQGDTMRFGDLSNNFAGTGKSAVSSPTRCVIAGGWVNPNSPFHNVIQYVNIATTGNALDFGDLQGFGRNVGTDGSSNGHGGLAG